MSTAEGTDGGVRETTVQSVDRAVSVLQVLAHRRVAALTEVAAEVGIHKTTAFRLLATLEGRGLVQQDRERGRYRLGHAAVQLAAGVARTYDVAVVCRPLCTQLAEDVGDTVNVVVREADHIITVDQASGGAIVASTDHVGKRGPLHATAAGKVFLAECTPEQFGAVVDAGLQRFTPHTCTDPAELLEQVSQVRVRGWALAREEHELGLIVVGAPVRDGDGAVAAAVTIGGPTYRITDEALPALTTQLLTAAARASWRLGAVKRG